ncbi:MAG: transcriptional regulator [Chloroflexi bacterium]|nr:transcriptional regulator [Chloroflexota bacterium]
MTGRTYGQFCGLARALELVGERWALLVVRDLVLAPKRFTDLHRGLPRIPTNVLSARLKELEQVGIVRRRVLPRPAAAVVYELTAYGRELEAILLQLGRWGAQSLGEPGPEDILTEDSLTLALRATFRPEAARQLRAGYELRVGTVVVHARIADGILEAGIGPLEAPDLIIDTGPVLRALWAGEISPGAAVESGAIRLTGDPALLDRFVELFRIPATPVDAPA